MTSFIVLNFDAQDDMYVERKRILDTYGFVGNFCLSYHRLKNGMTNEERRNYNDLIESGWQSALYAGVGSIPADINDFQGEWDSYIGDFVSFVKENDLKVPNVYHCPGNNLGVALYNSLVKNGFNMIRCDSKQYKASDDVYIQKAEPIMVVPTLSITKGTKMLLLKYRIHKAIRKGYSLSIMTHLVKDDSEVIEPWNCDKSSYCAILDIIKKYESKGKAKVVTWDELYSNYHG